MTEYIKRDAAIREIEQINPVDYRRRSSMDKYIYGERKDGGRTRGREFPAM